MKLNLLKHLLSIILQIIINQIYVEKKVHSENFSLNSKLTGNFLEITLQLEHRQ